MITREAIIAEALSWERTPFHHHARTKGLGIDCAMYLIEVYHAVAPEIVPKIDPGHYPPTWYQNHTEERYLNMVSQYADEFEGPPLPGDIVLFKTGLVFGHGAIVIDWPSGIHAAFADGRAVTRCSDLTQGWLAKFERKYFSVARRILEGSERV